MSDHLKRPAFWLLIILVGFPQIGETIYTPSLPLLTERLHTTANWMQVSLSIYFAGFAAGFVLWGWLADLIGRRNAILYGVLLFVAGSIGCLYAKQITFFLLCRFIQALGAATGAIVTQTMMRDCYADQQRSQVFARIFAVLAFSPAIGPLMGGYIAAYWGVAAVFLTLIGMGTAIWLSAWYALPETQPAHQVRHSAISTVAARMWKDTHVLTIGTLAGIMYGLIFCFYAEAPFIFIDKLGFTTAQYGWIGICESSSAVVAALLNKQLLKRLHPFVIIRSGLITMLAGVIVMNIAVFLPGVALVIMVSGFTAGMFVTLCGIGLAMPHCLSLGLLRYHHSLGTVGALFGLYYYSFTGLIMLLMSCLHNGSLVMLPLFFLCLASIAWGVNWSAVQRGWYTPIK